jgi:hypothetical protein
MLPGFRFLFAAIVLSVSVLVFGLGAAALLRAAHEQFASIPQRRAPPEPVFARRDEPPTLALLRVEPVGTENVSVGTESVPVGTESVPVGTESVPEVAEKVPDNVTGTVVLETVTPATAASEAPAAEPEKLAALKMDEIKPTEAAKPEVPAAEATPAVQVTPAETPIASEEVKLAAIAETPPSSTAAPITPEPVAQAPSLEGNRTVLKIAKLGSPAVTLKQPAVAKPADAKPNRNAARKRAQRAKERRRIAAARRAQLARQIAAQQAADPFAPTPAVRGR